MTKTVKMLFFIVSLFIHYTHGTRIIQVTYITNVPGSNGMKASTHGHLHTLQKVIYSIAKIQKEKHSF